MVLTDCELIEAECTFLLIDNGILSNEKCIKFMNTIYYQKPEMYALLNWMLTTLPFTSDRLLGSEIIFSLCPITGCFCPPSAKALDGFPVASFLFKKKCLRQIARAHHHHHHHHHLS